MSTTAARAETRAPAPAQLDVPVAMIVFNRPEATARVFAAVAAQRPTRLLVVADGARPDRAGEAQRVAAVRAVFDAVDWPCTVETDFSPVNLGCKKRVASGISWVFSRVPEAIILEDDCLPSPAFFRYCAALLDKYRDDRRIYAISGTNFERRSDVAPGHYFSRFALMWGWATWADRWADYVGEPQDANAVIARTWAGRLWPQLHWRKVFEELRHPDAGTWDFQWVLTLWRHGALAARPTQNLVANIGFGDGATHTVDPNGGAASLPVYDGDADFAEPVGPVAPDLVRDRFDERTWALFSWKALVIMYLPWLYRLRQKLR